MVTSLQLYVTVIFIQDYKLNNVYLTVNSEFNKQAQQKSLKINYNLTGSQRRNLCTFTYKSYTPEK